jgi:trehalose 6-phosphate synthase/phosphatase
MPGSFIEEKKYSVAWHYRASEKVDEAEIRRTVSKDLTPLNIHNDFHILHGKKVIEIKSTYTNKGKFVEKLIDSSDFDFILAIGDDLTDEDMFHVLHRKYEYTIKVGHGNTSAKYNIVGVNQVLSFLNQLHSKSEQQEKMLMS